MGWQGYCREPFNAACANFTRVPGTPPETISRQAPFRAPPDRQGTISPPGPVPGFSCGSGIYTSAAVIGARIWKSVVRYQRAQAPWSCGGACFEQEGVPPAGYSNQSSRANADPGKSRAGFVRHCPGQLFCGAFDLAYFAAGAGQIDPAPEGSGDRSRKFCLGQDSADEVAAGVQKSEAVGGDARRRTSPAGKRPSANLGERKSGIPRRGTGARSEALQPYLAS